jgi:hypothetical protein
MVTVQLHIFGQKKLEFEIGKKGEPHVPPRAGFGQGEARGPFFACQEFVCNRVIKVDKKVLGIF